MLLNTPIKIGKPGPGAHVPDQLAAYLDYELPEPQRAAVREHLRGCPQCENDLATLRAAKQLLRDLPAAVPPRSFKLNPNAVAALNARPTNPARLFGLPRLALALRLASAVCCLLLLPLLGTTALESQVPEALTARSQAPQIARVVAPTFLPEATPAAAAATSPPLAMDGIMAAPTQTTAAVAGINAAPTAPPAPAAASAGDMAAATPTTAAAADAPSSATFGSAADAQLAPTAEDATVAAAQNPSAFTGSRVSPGIAPAIPSSSAPAAKVALGSNPASSGEVTTPATGAAGTYQLTTPPPTAEPPSLLPWEIGLALAALALALASIPVARRAR